MPVNAGFQTAPPNPYFIGSVESLHELERPISRLSVCAGTQTPYYYDSHGYNNYLDSSVQNEKPKPESYPAHSNLYYINPPTISDDPTPIVSSVSF